MLTQIYLTMLFTTLHYFAVGAGLAMGLYMGYLAVESVLEAAHWLNDSAKRKLRRLLWR